MLVAIVALVSSMTGGAVAATLITGDDIAKNAVAKKHIKKNAVVSKKVKNGSLLSSDFKPGQLVAGAPGPVGPKGDKGDACLPTIPECVGPKGDKGDPGTNGTNGTDGQDLTHNSVLPSGQTITGVWGVHTSIGESGVETFQFRPRLPADIPNANTHYVEGASAPNCPGQGQAAPGHFCIYQVWDGSITPGSRFNPTAITGGADATGGMMYFSGTADSSNGWGVWAVTAP